MSFRGTRERVSSVASYSGCHEKTFASLCFLCNPCPTNQYQLYCYGVLVPSVSDVANHAEAVVRVFEDRGNAGARRAAACLDMMPPRPTSRGAPFAGCRP